jgi:hypothetical protein
MVTRTVLEGYLFSLDRNVKNVMPITISPSCPHYESVDKCFNLIIMTIGTGRRIKKKDVA